MAARLYFIAVAGAMALQGRSARPREFKPLLAAAPADRQAFDVVYADCQRLMAEGKLDSSGRLASAGSGAATGATAMAVGGAAALAAGGYTGLAVVAATGVLLPFAVIGGAWKMAKAKKTKKERSIQQTAAGCLTERGYPVVGWNPCQNSRGPRPAPLCERCGSRWTLV